MQLVGEAHDTPEKSVMVVPAGSGLGTMVQLVPSQCSTRVLLIAVGVLSIPTAVQSVADRQETPVS